MVNNILIIEDDPAIREGVRILMEGENFHVEEAVNGFEGLKKLSDATHLIILDVMMPGISGYKTCEEIRKRSNVPVLFLTAKDQESDKLLGLMSGGDDYLVKPFSYAELFVRVKALLRRHLIYDKAGEKVEPKKYDEWIEAKNIRINTQNNCIYVNGIEISLTEKEYSILLLFMKNPGKIFSVQNLYESVWEVPYLYSSGNTVMVHIRRLRKKIEEDPQNPKLIVSVWGKGYRFEKDK
ncbi:MAG: response regulator transcription factor [Eubacteriales bacterium]|nr:response regulator transcription factor [Eubacteriales bacterium]